MKLNWIGVWERLPDFGKGVLISSRLKNVTAAQRIQVAPDRFTCDTDKARAAKGYWWVPYMVSSSEDEWLDIDDSEILYWADMPESP